MGIVNRFAEGLSASRARLTEQINGLLKRGPKLDDEFWDMLEETLITADLGVDLADSLLENLKKESHRQALPDAAAVIALMKDMLAREFCSLEKDILGGEPAVVVFVGINGAGKTTTVGKLAAAAHESGRRVLIGSADTFRAAAIEQLDVWAQRAGVEIVSKTRGADAAGVCFATIERAEELGSDLVLLDTAGRLHTSDDLMRELQKVVNVVKKRSTLPVYILLVVDATTGQNGLQQAVEFNKALGLDGIILTKMDGSAKGGIALHIAHDLALPVVRVGVGERVGDLKPFDAREFVEALMGTDSF